MVGFAFSCFGDPALPVAPVRRVDAAEGGGLPGQGRASPRRSGSREHRRARGGHHDRNGARTRGRPRGAAARWPRSTLDAEYAPLASDARAILRRKTLLGETFVEITHRLARRRQARRRRAAGRRARGGDRRARRDRSRPTTPTTRRAFRIWQQQLGIAVGDRGEDLNNALGQLPDFTASGTDLLDGARRAARARCAGLVRDTGEVYAALSRTRASCAALIRELARAVRPDRRAAREPGRGVPDLPHVPGRVERPRSSGSSSSRATRGRWCATCSPVARELRPTVRAARASRPTSKRFFGASTSRSRASRAGAAGAARGARRDAPAVRLARARSCRSSTRSSSGSSCTSTWSATSSATARPALWPTPSRRAPDGETGHYLRQLGVTGLESIGIHREPPVVQPRQRLPARRVPGRELTAK